MKILFVTPETYYTGGGGIATYSKHAGDAMRHAGHDVFTLTWQFNANNEKTTTDVGESIYLLNINRDEVWSRYPNGPFNQALSFYMLEYILDAIELWDPDIIESTDYLSPLFAYQNVRRNGSLSPKHRKPTLIFNHGMQREIYRTDASIPSAWDRQNLATERTTLKWADLVFSPSRQAMNTMIRQCGPLDHSVLVPEPFYWSGIDFVESKPSNKYVHMGRLSISKGIGNVIHFLNAIDSFAPIDDILLVGGKQHIPFKISDAEEYILQKVNARIRNKIVFPGRIPLDTLKGLVSSGESRGVSMNFSAQETFNYAFLEMVDLGLSPYGMCNTAMSDFYPPHLHQYLIPSDFDLKKLPLIHEYISNGNNFRNDVKAYAAELTSPEKYAKRYEELTSKLIFKPKKRQVKRQLEPKDVTFLMATYNPTPYILEAVESLKQQSVKGSRLLIISDGSDRDESNNILDELSKETSVSVIKSSTNEGLCSTRRKLIAACQTPLSVFFDDDDIVTNDYVEKTLEVYNNNEIGANAVMSWRRNFGISNDLTINNNIDDYEFHLCNDTRITALVETKALEIVNFSPRTRHGEADDWDFWLRFIGMGFKTTMLPEPLFRYRTAVGSMSWPWSMGQAALTAELLSSRILDAVKAGNAPEDIFLDMMTSRELLRLQAEERFESNWSNSNEAAVLRARFIAASRARHPFLGRLLSLTYRGSSWLARKSIGGSL